MSKKQSSIEYYSNMVAEILGDEIVNKLSIEQTLRFSYLDKDVKAMHKDEIEEAYGHGQINGYLYAHQKEIIIFKENYFNKTFGGQDNE